MDQASAASFEPIACVNCGAAEQAHLELVRTEVVHDGHLHGLPLRVVTCGQCGLVFLNPQPTRAALGRFYESEYYRRKKVQVAGRIQQTQWQKEILFTWLCAHLPPIQDWRILDIGCGYGDWLRHFDKSNQVSGIEQSQQAAAVANKEFGVEVRQCAFEENGYEAKRFDLITGLAIIEHFADPLAALVEVNRLLKPGGFLYLQTPDVIGAAMRKGVERYFKLVHTYYYSANTLASLCRKAGFNVLATRRRPPVLSTSDSLRPGNFWEGELDLVARKDTSVTLEEARAIRGSGDDPNEVIRLVQQAIARDMPYAKLDHLYQVPVAGRMCNHAVRAWFLLTGRDTRRKDRRAEQLRLLQKEG